MKKTTQTTESLIGINWNDINLNSAWERNLDLLDPYNFETLLLEIHCNLKDINPATVRAQAIESIKSKYQTAIEILDANLLNITKHAKKDRERP